MVPHLSERLAFLRTLERLLIDRRPTLEAALAADFRKPALEVLTSETSVILHEIRAVRAVARDYLRPRPTGLPLWLWPGRSRVVREPRGRVLVLSPWNFPLQLALVPVVGAVAAGNTVVLKPSELTPATSLAVADLVRDAFPPELVQVVLGGAEEAVRLLAEPWGLVFFTGSPAVGKKVAHAAAETLSPVVLELGGKCPAVVLDGADLTVAARRIVWGKVANAGQVCVAPDYALVPRDRLDEFVRQCRKALEEFFPGGAAGSPDYCAIIHDRAFDRLASLLGRGTVAAGGGLDRTRRYVEPTILTGVTWEDPVMRDEIFGPILPVLAHDGPEDALVQVSRSPDPLAAFAFGPPSAARALLDRIDAGGKVVNDVGMHFVHPGLPFGGLRGSGTGQYHGRWSLETFTRPAGVLELPRSWDWPFRYPPYGKFPRKLLEFLLH